LISTDSILKYEYSVLVTIASEEDRQLKSTLKTDRLTSRKIKISINLYNQFKNRSIDDAARCARRYKDSSL